MRSTTKDGNLQTINSEDNDTRKTLSRLQKSRASVTASQTSRKQTLKVNNITFEEELGTSVCKGGRRGSMGRAS